MAFRGTFDQKLDAKNRLTIPARFRAELAGGIVLAKPPDQQPCIWVTATGEYESFTAAALSELSPLSADRLELERFFFGNSLDADLDAAGRVMLPSWMLEHAGLARDVVVVGAGGRLELWDPTHWNDHRPALAKGVAEITARVGHPA